MLTKNTVILLNKACSRAGALYEKGGLSYTYCFGHDLAHTVKGINQDSGNEFAVAAIGIIEKFYEEAMFRISPSKVSDETKEYVALLLSYLSEDFEGMLCQLANYQSDGMSSILKLLFIDGNDYHELELFWSVD